MTDEQQNPQKLFSEFRPTTAADWEEKARKDLRDTPLEDLNWQTYEGITIKPYFTKEDIQHLPFITQQPGRFPFVRGHKTDANVWLNIQHIEADGDGKGAIEKAADALARGADGIHFIIRDCELFDQVYLTSRIDLSKTHVGYTLSKKPDAFLTKLLSKLEKQGILLRDLRGSVNFSPMTSHGELSQKENKTISRILALTKDSPNFYGITVGGTDFSSIGASVTQEIAYTISAAVAYLNRLTNAGNTLDSAFQNMQFAVSSGTNYFFEIAKLRALRLLWAAVTEAYQTEPALAAKLRIHCTTSSWFQATLDPYVNVLRATTEAMAAVVAGCDSLTVTPFNSTFKRSDEFSERVARNVSIILKEEAYLDKAIDPAAGSYYLETLTNVLANKAWDLFKEVEAKGGFESAYESGFILASITEVSRKKFKAIATGNDVLVGINKYPNPNEQVDFDPEELIQRSDFDTTRAAYPTEVMRMATELHLRKRKRRPKAIVAIIGDTDSRKLNATFATELFKCAGFEIEQQHFDNVEAASDSLLHAAVEVVVVSASEVAYAREFVPKLRAHQTRATVILAEDPQHMKEELMAQGFDEFLFEDCNTSTILELVHRKLSKEDGNNISL